MRIFFLFILYLLISGGIFAQTTPLTFTPLSGDFKAPNRGPQMWNGATSWDDVNNPTIPSGNGNSYNRYYRFNWQDIESNTVQGSYTWTTFDGIFNNAIDAGQMVTFGIMDFCSACGPSGVIPSYVQTLMTNEGKPGWTTPGGFVAPNYQSNNWQLRYNALLRAVANHIATTSHSGKTFTSAFLGFDMRHYGDFGEGNGYATGTCPSGAQVTDAYLIQMTDSARAIFPNVQLTVPMSYVAPNNIYSNAQGTAGAQAAYYVLTATNSYGRIGWRRDNIGDNGYNSYLTGTTATYNGVALLPLIMNCWQVAPVGGEPANDIVGISRCGTPMCDMHNEDTLFHMSYFGNGNWPINSSTSPGWPQLTTNVRAGAAEEGYILAPIGGSMSTTLYRYSLFNIIINWQNSGNAPVYENYKVVFTLKNSGGTAVLSDTSTFNPKLFLPGTTTISDNFNVGNISTGSGMSLYLSVIDPNGYKVPLPLAITGRLGDGSYLIRSGITIANRNLLVVLWGESNAAGNADNAPALPSELVPRSTVQILDHNTNQFSNLHIGANNEQNTFISSPDSPNTKHGLELGLANEVDSGFLQNPTYLVKIGVSGSVICQWFSGGCIKVGDNTNVDLWNGYMHLVDTAIARMNAFNTPYDVVVWGSLGLNNLYNQSTPAGHFYDSMKLFIANLRARMALPTAQFYLTNFDNPPAQSYSWKYLFDSLAKTDAHVHSIPVVGATYIDAGVHYDYQGFKLIAHNIVDTMIAIQSPPAPSASAGVDQSITLPTNSVTLNGSLSINAISYAWTQVSGPNTATITNSTNVTATASNLIAGTYVFQLSINSGVSTDQMSVIVNPAFTGSVSIFTTQTPTATTGNDNPPGCCNTSTGQEVGLKFRSSVAGYITAIRFYKTTGNTGTHTGELYSSTGTRLGQVVFSGETATGWQTASFANPIPILANTTYVAAYFSSAGNYVEDNFYFSNSGVTNGPLTALQTGVDGGNAPFQYSATPVFPTQLFHDANYWVDVVFSSKVVIGSGSGAVSLTSMSGLNPGDTVFIATQTGTYTSLTLKNLNNIVIRPQSGRPTFTTTSTLCGNKGLNLGYLNFIGTASVGIDFSCGTEYGDSLHNLYFQGWTGADMSAHNNVRYVYGDTTTYMWYKMNIDSVKEFNCAELIQGSFGRTGDPAGAPDVFRQLNVSRIIDEATQATAGEGTGVRGICFHCSAHDIRVTSITQRGASGDVGWIYGYGAWHVWNLYKSGGPGYVVRMNTPMSERSDPWDNWLYNSFKTNSTEYGMVDYQFSAGDTVAGKFYGPNSYIFNNTMVHTLNDTFGFWSPMINNGQVPPNANYFASNNLGCDIGENNNNAGKPKLIFNNGGWNTIATDTSNNQYYKFVSQAQLDSVTNLFTNSLGSFQKYMPTALSPSSVLHAGKTSPIATVDYNGATLRVPPDLGYMQFTGNVSGCGCILGLRKGSKKTIIRQ